MYSSYSGTAGKAAEKGSLQFNMKLETLVFQIQAISVGLDIGQKENVKKKPLYNVFLNCVFLDYSILSVVEQHNCALEHDDIVNSS